MAQAYYGRAAAYDTAMGKAAPSDRKHKDALVEVLTRNLYPEDEGAADGGRLAALADDVFELEEKLQLRAVQDILAGQVFGD